MKGELTFCMCGIAGFLGAYPSQLLDVMSEQIRRRGPDGSGTFFDGELGAGLVHRRLAIIDLTEGGAQPMLDLERGVVLSYNGEVYNFRELRAELEALGHRFKSTSDTEVVLRAYMEWGDGCFVRLEGIFALAIWDERRNEMILARDHLGVKPLYWSRTPRGFVFASELKALVHAKDLDRSIDEDALYAYLIHLWSPGERTPFKSVKKVAPGTFMRLRDGAPPDTRAFYEFPCAEGGLSLEASEARLEEALKKSVERQVVADVPIGAFLSGGLDSSALVALAQRTREAPLPCYCIDYSEEEARREGLTRDAPFAERVARHTGAALHVITAAPFHVDDLREMVETLDEPLADPAPLYVGQIARAAREAGIRVLLSGAGGDDLLTGYRRHRAVDLERYWTWLPTSGRRLLQAATACSGSSVVARRLSKAFAGAALSENERIVNYFCWIAPDRVRALMGGVEGGSPMLDYLAQLPEGVAPLQKMLLLEARFFLVDHNLTYTDKMSMKHGVEVRVPLIDLEMVRAAASIPLSLKQNGSEGKWIFKKVMERYLPRDVIYRKKTGFGAPVRQWVRGPLSGPINDELLAPTSRVRAHIDISALRRLMQDDREGRIDASYTVLSAMCIELWLQRYSAAPAIVH